tara:strand:+ start:140 stop:328 length:189 start_codon:yes stop_codon:yes gene_type:complete
MLYLVLMGTIVGYILIAAGLADFGLSYLGINLTSFLPEQISKFTPLMLGGLGALILSGQGKK